MPATAFADPDPGPQTEVQPAPADGLLHNVTYRARADGTSRGAVVAYKIDDTNVNSEQPTLLPGSTFEVNTVLADPKQAGMELSIQWPYGSNLHCEILVDDQIVAQADQFIAPTVVPPQGRSAVRRAAMRRPAGHTYRRRNRHTAGPAAPPAAEAPPAAA